MQKALSVLRSTQQGRILIAAMTHDLLHIDGKPYVLVPLHDYNALKNGSGKNDTGADSLPEEVQVQLLSGADHPLKILRRYRGYNRQADLAAACGLSRAYLAEIETGRKPGSVSALKSIAQVLDVPLEVLTQ